MRLLLLPLVALLACAAEPGAPAPPAEPAPPPPSAEAAPPSDAFDARAWLAETRAVLEDTTRDYDARSEALRAQARLLDEAVGWSAVCAKEDEEYGGPLAGGVEPWAVLDELHFAFGFLVVTPFEGDEYLIEATCVLGAYQGTAAYVHLIGDEVRLVRFSEGEGEPEAVAQVGLSGYNPAEGVDPTRTFTLLAKGRGLGDCGTLSTYRLDEQSVARLVERREKDACEGPTETCDGEPCVDPLQWPVVYPR